MEPRPAPPPAAALPELERPESPHPRRAQRLRLCVDFGTSACAIGWAASTENFVPANLAQEAGKWAHTVESLFAVPKAAHGRAVIGSYARELQDNKPDDYTFYRSLKRLLSDGRTDPNAVKQRTHALTCVIEELLLLALAPVRSGTLAVVEADPKKREVLARDLGIEGFPTERIPIHGVDLFMSVPNAFGAFECEIIQNAGEAALKRALDFLGKELGWGPRTGDTTPKLIREAEAVVWWELTQARGTLDAQRILVFDVGGGSSDAALVSATRGDYTLTVETLRHSGVTFGGNDVDQLFLSSLQKKVGGLDPLQTIMKAVGADNRLTLLAGLEGTKAAWANNVNQALAGGDKGLAELWTEWLAAVLSPTPGPFKPVTGVQTEFAAAGGLSKLTHPDYQQRLGAFLRGTVGTIVDDLFPESGQDNEVHRVILSGRGSLLPGLREALTLRLQERGVIKEADQVGLATPKGDEDTDFMKLACVRGVWAASVDTTAERGLSHFVSHPVTYKLGSIGAQRALWPARTRLVPGGEARAILRLTEAQENLNLEFSQRRFPISIRTYFGNADEWASRQIGAIAVPVIRGQRDFLIQFDCARWRLKVWDLRKYADPQEIPDMLEQNPVGRTNPITGLPFGWGDE